MNKKLLFIFIFLFIGLILYIIYYFKKSKIEHFNDFNDIYDSPGNTKIIMENPGDLSYVLKQSALKDSGEKTRYQLNLDIQPEKKYKIKSWVTYDNNWDGNYNLYNILVYNNSGKPQMSSSTGVLIERKKINDYIWELREHTFNIANNSNGKVEVYLGYNPENTVGARYIANVSLNKDHGNLNNTPLIDDVMVFLSAHHENSIKSNSKVWKDASSNGNDFNLDKNIIIQDKYVDLKSLIIHGPPSNKLIPNNKQFTIFFSGISEEYSTGEIFRLFSNNLYNTGVNVCLENSIGVNNKMILDMIGNKYKFDLGITQKHCIYGIVVDLTKKKDNEKLLLYIDGYKLIPKIEKNAAWNNDTQSKYYPKDTLKLNDVNCQIANPDKGELKFKMDFFIIYSKAINEKLVINITHYLSSFRKDEQYSERPDTRKYICNDGTNLVTDKSKIICPFKSSENSPCSMLECCGANWNNIQNVSSKCKMTINNYCKNNIDSMCSILRSEKKTKTSCSGSNTSGSNTSCSGSKTIIENLNNENTTNIKQNKIIESEITESKLHDNIQENNNTKDNNKQTMDKQTMDKQTRDKNSLNIDTNIDMSKYIRKDKIPCWGCNLDNITK